jgi:cyclopropane fatty-acyl-phospholipid synthase-like methyltransferase
MKSALHKIIRRHGKTSFIFGLPAGAKILDVGCGNDSPARIKSARPDLWYIGLDVGDYNQKESRAIADEYVITEPELFAERIRDFEGGVDAVISAHNLEHCNQPDKVITAMAAALRPGGRLYLSFPCEKSVHFPHRKGTLNFYDDETHRSVPEWAAVLDSIHGAGLRVDYAAQQSRSLAMALFGLLLEPISSTRGRVMRGTWDLYGFESIIWATRPNSS